MKNKLLFHWSIVFYVSKAHDRFLFLSVLIFCLILSKNAAFRVIFRPKVPSVQINVLPLYAIHVKS